MKQAPKSEPHKDCGAKTRSGGRCKKQAGWGTDHLGAGKCRLHGGASPVKHGRYRDPEIKRLHALPHLNEARQLTISDDANDARAVRLSIIAKKISEKKSLTAEDARLIADLCERSSRIEYRQQKIAQGRQALLTLEEVVRIFKQFMEALLSSGCLVPGSEQKVIGLAADMRLVEVPESNAN